MEAVAFAVIFLIGVTIAIRVTKIVIRFAVVLALAAAFYVFLYPKVVEYYPKVLDLLE